MKLCIDAGHNYSGVDTGALGNGLREQDVTWNIANHLATLCVYSNFKVILTRKNLTDNLGTTVKESIDKRCLIANNNQANAFISIHCNAGGGTGAETLIYGKGGEAERLAIHVQSNLSQIYTDRGVKVRTDLGVLKNTQMPAILAECGFIDNPNDAQIMKNNSNDIAYKIYLGICNHYGIIPKESEEDMEKIQELENKIQTLQNPMIYNYIDNNMPDWAKPTIQKLVDKGYLKGNENGLGLTDEMLRIYVVLDRAGNFGA